MVWELYLKIIPDGSRVIRMNEKDLIPFDWEEYKAGKVWVESTHQLAKVIYIDGDVRLQKVFNGDSFSQSELRLPKKINKERIGSSFDDFMREDIQE
jgi:hypothetical protein